MIQYIENTNLAYCDGLKFRKDKKSGYWLCSTKHERLHRYIYKKYYGEIPKGYEVHHIDHNKNNNDISNLQLLTKKEHNRLHYEEMSEEEKERRRRNLQINARPKATEWHKSEEGRKWHLEHYERVKEKMLKKNKFKCLVCNLEFESSQTKSKFCSNKCKAKYWRMTHKK